MIQSFKDIERIIRWAVDTDGFKFAKEIYYRDEPDEYTRDKFRGMQTNFINWIANLDDKHRAILVDVINKTEWSDSFIPDENFEKLIMIKEQK